MLSLAKFNWKETSELQNYMIVENKQTNKEQTTNWIYTLVYQ